MYSIKIINLRCIGFEHDLSEFYLECCLRIAGTVATDLRCHRMQTHNVKLNDVAKEAGKAARVEARGARLLNGSGALCLLLQLLPDKHAKQHCVVVANAQLSAEEGHPDVQALEAALLLKELQVRRAAVLRLGGTCRSSRCAALQCCG